MKPASCPHHRPPPLPAPPSLFLVDGYALIYRAFFAMISRPLTTARGENTSAAWGVTNFLFRLLTQHRPDYLGWIHDLGVSFREQRYPAYKATREKLDEQLQQDFDRSVERIGQILGAFRIPVLGREGYEADDVIGTLAVAAAARGLRAVIVSGDKDFYQLIGPGIVLLNPGRGGPTAIEEHWVDESNASERLGVPPERVVDFLALVGDSSDNIPGVKGVGPKTALELLQAYGDLDGVLAHAAEIPAKRAREAVLQHADLARLSRELVTIQRDVPIALDLEALQVRPPDAPRLAELFTELEFRSLIPRLAALESVIAGPRAGPPPPVTAAAGAAPVIADPVIVDDPALLGAVVAQRAAPRPSWRSTPRPRRSTRFARSSSACRSRSRGGPGISRSPTSPRMANWPGTRRPGISLRSAARRSARSGRCSKIPACRRRATTSSTTGWCCGGRA